MKAKIKIKKNHPLGQMYLGSHKITMKEQIFELNERDIEISKSPEAKSWFKISQVSEDTILTIEEPKIEPKKRGRKKKIK